MVLNHFDNNSDNRFNKKHFSKRKEFSLSSRVIRCFLSFCFFFFSFRLINSIQTSIKTYNSRSFVVVSRHVSFRGIALSRKAEARVTHRSVIRSVWRCERVAPSDRSLAPVSRRTRMMRVFRYVSACLGSKNSRNPSMKKLCLESYSVRSISSSTTSRENFVAIFQNQFVQATAATSKLC